MIYLDHASATPLHPQVLEKMLPYLREHYGNASSIHSFGRTARNAIDLAREQVAAILHCTPHEIIFTSGGTESNNWAIFGMWNGAENPKAEMITTTIEHEATLGPLRQIEQIGGKVHYLPVSRSGLITPEQVQEKINQNTLLVTIIYANNEIGTIQPVNEIGKVMEGSQALYHLDACQAATTLSLNTKELNCQLLTLNGSKIYGPKGIGILFVKDKTRIKPLIYGGGQEFRFRSGTENVAGIVGFAEALKIAQEEKENEKKRLTTLRDYFLGELGELVGTKINGDAMSRLANNINVTFPHISAEALLMKLDLAGIAASSGSACTSGSIEPSHVLLALGLTLDEAKRTLRFTLGRQNTKQEIDQTLAILKEL